MIGEGSQPRQEWAGETSTAPRRSKTREATAHGRGDDPNTRGCEAGGDISSVAQHHLQSTDGPTSFTQGGLLASGAVVPPTGKGV